MMFKGLKEIGKLLDDFEAAEADINSGDRALLAHGLENLATLYTTMAKRAPLARIRDMMLEQAENVRERQRDIARHEENNKLWRAAFERQQSAEAKRRERIEETNLRVGQADLFPSPAVKETE